MTTDSTNKEPAAPRPDWRIQGIIDIRIARVPYEPPKLRYFKSFLAKYREAIQFLVEIRGELPGRARVPVLFVGSTPVYGGEFVEDNVVRFLAFEMDALRRGAPMTLGWDGDAPAEDVESKHHYVPPGKDGKYPRKKPRKSTGKKPRKK